MSATVKAKKWGNSLGIVIPREAVEEGNLKEGEELEMIILRKTDTVRKLFGIAKGQLKKSTQEMLRETDKELWGIDRK